MKAKGKEDYIISKVYSHLDQLLRDIYGGSSTSLLWSVGLVSFLFWKLKMTFVIGNREK